MGSWPLYGVRWMSYRMNMQGVQRVNGRNESSWCLSSTDSVSWVCSGVYMYMYSVGYSAFIWLASRMMSSPRQLIRQSSILYLAEGHTPYKHGLIERCLDKNTHETHLVSIAQALSVNCVNSCEPEDIDKHCKHLAGRYRRLIATVLAALTLRSNCPHTLGFFCVYLLEESYLKPSPTPGTQNTSSAIFCWIQSRQP